MSETQPEQPASFEHNLSELERIVEQLESGDLELAESMERFKRGVELSKQCRTMLDAAQQTIDEITAADEPAPEASPDEKSD